MISVIVPVYNVENYIERCIKSIINQTYTDIELILVDDGSTDRSGKICDEYKKIDNRIKVIHKENEGVSAARNFGIQIARGSLFAFIDGDDYIDANMFEIMISKFDDDTVDICICDIECIYEKYDNNYVITMSNCNNITNNIDGIKLLLTNEMRGFTWNKIYRRDLFCSNNISYPKGMYYEDIFTSVQLIYQSRNIKYVKKPFYKYVQRNGSITSRCSEKHINDYLQAVNNSSVYLENKNINKYKNAFILINFCNILLLIYKHNIFDNSRKYYKEECNSLCKDISAIETIFSDIIPIKNKIIYFLYKTNLYFYLKNIFSKFNT